jgi:hypothetical protein
MVGHETRIYATKYESINDTSIFTTGIFDTKNATLTRAGVWRMGFDWRAYLAIRGY